MGQQKVQGKTTNYGSVIREDDGGEGASLPEQMRLNETEGMEGVKSFEDVLDIVGTSGLWNVLVFLLCSYCSFTHPMYVVSYQFIGAAPDHWCRVDPLINANWTQQQIIDLAIPNRTDGKGHEGCLMYDYNYTMAINLGYEAALANRNLLSEGQADPIHCSARDFNFTQYSSSVVTEWDLVCEKLSLYSTTQATSHVGLLIGAGVSGYLLDLFGRRRVVMACSLLAIVCAGSQALAADYYIYIFMKTLTSVFVMGYYVGCFVILMELCSLKQRSSVGSMFVMPYAVGFMVLPGIAYFIRPWRWLQLAFVLPLLPMLIYFWFLPESPRWLISEGRYQEALKVLLWAARVNGRNMPPSEALMATLKALPKDASKKSRFIEQNRQNKKDGIVHKIWMKFKHIFVLLALPALRKRALVCFFSWFAVSMVYFGISLSSINLSADPYLYMFLGGLTEVPAYLFLWATISFLGRKVSVISFFILGASTISIISILLYSLDEAPVPLLMFLSLTGKMGFTAAFHLIYVHTAELFPTKYRSLAVGESCVMARMGSIISPYVNDLLGDVVSWGPSAVFALVSLMAAGLSLLLPETGGTELIEDSENPPSSDKRVKKKPGEEDSEQTYV